MEIAGESVDEARASVRFDEMAVFPALAARVSRAARNAFERAGIEAWFDRGTRRPHPSGRAFLASQLRAERLSANPVREPLAGASAGSECSAAPTSSPLR